MFIALRLVYAAIVGFVRPAAGSIVGYLNLRELASVLVASAGSGSAAAALVAVLADPAILSPSAPGVLVAAVAFAAELARRYSHGASPSTVK